MRNLVVALMIPTKMKIISKSRIRPKVLFNWSTQTFTNACCSLNFFNWITEDSMLHTALISTIVSFIVPYISAIIRHKIEKRTRPVVATMLLIKVTKSGTSLAKVNMFAPLAIEMHPNKLPS